MTGIIFLLTIIILCIFLYFYDQKSKKQKKALFLDSLKSESIKANNKTDFDRIHKGISDNDSFLIDDITWNDLSYDDVFKKINYCGSAIGEEYLYRLLRNPKQDIESIHKFNSLIEIFNDDKLYAETAFFLKEIGGFGKNSVNEYIKRLDEMKAGKNSFHYLLILLYLISFGLFFVNSIVGIFSLIASLIIGIYTYFVYIAKIDKDIALISYIYRVKKYGIQICELTNNSSDKITRIPCNKLTSILLPVNKYVGSGNPVDMILDYIRILFHIDIIYFNLIVTALLSNKQNIIDAIDIIGLTDSAVSIRSLRKALKDNCCIPEFDNEGLFIKDLYHPLLSNPVKNDVDTNNCILLTGSNASGKSTFMKEIAINVICAQSICTCFASKYNAPLMNVYTSMSLRDNISAGESFYVAEIKAVKRIFDAKGKVLCFIDELLKGTNTAERICAGAEILTALKELGHQVFAATHDYELIDMLDDEYKLYHLEEANTENDISFSYKVLEGPSSSACAIKLLEYIGFDKKICEQAENRITKYWG